MSHIGAKPSSSCQARGVGALMRAHQVAGSRRVRRTGEGRTCARGSARDGNGAQAGADGLLLELAGGGADALRLVILGWLDAQTLAFQPGCSGYFEHMVRSRLPDTASVPIVLRISISEEDVARIDQVLARPEFTEWSRSEWCLEIIRTALRYYVGDSASPEAEPAPAVPEARRAPAPDSVPPAIAPEPPLPDADEVAPEPPGRSDCSHPQDARDYQTGTCAACGAILWD